MHLRNSSLTYSTLRSKKNHEIQEEEEAEKLWKNKSQGQPDEIE